MTDGAHYICIEANGFAPLIAAEIFHIVQRSILGKEVVDSSSILSPPLSNADSLFRHCPWMRPHTLDWIYQAPAMGLLFVNSIFLVMIMWVLITKLRSATNAETQQYRKATKALLVLIPLLGITYVLVIAGPTHGLSARVYACICAILLSTQFSDV
ncbi:hypothetical protein J437_LFUL018070 [Ladona fulva]|uniref:G-protein coupled receptors family 2 profile 2 domain-containing protein n=1 Tax=Ladona fulva TaxID=123851 RepID=A0A8K0JUS7_LADFU|nr:hypothetical protein J437_LFUL018070 [Ladona fulva]